MDGSDRFVAGAGGVNLEALGLDDVVTRVGAKGFTERVGMRGRVTAVDAKTGKELFKTTNLVTTVGKAQAAKRWVGVTANAMNYIAVGTGTNDPAAGDTALQTELTEHGGERAAATVTTAANVAKAEVTHSYTGGPHVITEIGWLDAASTGNLGARQKFGGWEVTTGDQVTWKWEMTFG